MVQIGRTVLVTGGSAGLGAAIARDLSQRGWVVHAASRSGTSPIAAEDRARALRLDVTDGDAVRRAVESIVAEGGRLDAVVANAGISVSAPFEELPPGRARAIIETNFWGVANVVRAALGPMRARRAGTVLAVGSLAGLVAPPGEALYAASKHALEGFLEALQYEVRPFGVRVLLVEPGFIRTNLATASGPVPGVIDDYALIRDALAAHWQRSISGGLTAEAAAARICDLLERPTGFRHRIGRDAVWVPALKRLLPETVFFAVTRRVFGLHG